MIIVNTNIIFSALLVADSKLLAILQDDKNKFIAPTFLFVEIFKHKNKILKYSKIDEAKLLEILNQLFNNIQFISDKTLSDTSLKLAYELCREVDLNDFIFIAFTIEFNALFWTRDKKLIEGLKKKGFDKFYYP